MRLDLLQEILNYTLDDEGKETLIIRWFAKDKNAIPNILKVLHEEREQTKEFIQDMNLELSRAHVFIEKDGDMSKDVTKSFLVEKIDEFYLKYKFMISHCFTRQPKK